MANKKVFTDESLATFVDEIKGYTDSVASTKMDKTNPTGTGSFSLNRKANSTVGTNSVAIGVNTVASGTNSVAIGSYSIASGDDSVAIAGGDASGTGAFAEGGGQASGEYSHAEGEASVAEGYTSHAEGSETVASGEASHSEGYGTIASSDYQHVQGMYNIEDTEGIYAHIVGNGDASEPANAHTLDWDGNAWYAGNVYVGGTSKKNGTKLVKSSDVIAISNGGTGATTAAGALTNLGITATATELNYVDGVTSNVQTQIDLKMDKTNPTGTGILSIKGTADTDPQIQFFENGATSYSNRIYSNNDYMKFEGVTGGYDFDAHIRTTKGLYTFGKRSMDDGKPGCVIYDGVIDIVGSTSTLSSITKPTIRFYINGSTSPDALIDLDSSDVMNFANASSYKFDKEVYVNGTAVKAFIDKFYTYSGTKTTNSNGNIAVQLDATKYVILGATFVLEDGSTTNCSTYTNGGKVSIHVENNSGTELASKSGTLRYVYYAL